MIETSYKYYVFMTKRAWNQTLKTTGNTGHFCKNTEFYRQDILGQAKDRTLQEIPLFSVMT